MGENQSCSKFGEKLYIQTSIIFLSSITCCYLSRFSWRHCLFSEGLSLESPRHALMVKACLLAPILFGL